MEKSFYKYRFSAFQVIGLIMLSLGMLALVLTGVNAVKYKRVGQKALHYESNADETGSAEIASGEEYPGEEPYSPAEAKESVYSTAPGLMLGAALIICAVPMFYIPHGEGVRLRRRRRRVSDNDMTDKEFDYPDDEFDFILDEETRKKLLEEKFRRIYEKNHKQ